MGSGMDSLQRWLRPKLGPQVYEALGSVLRFRTESSTRRSRRRRTKRGLCLPKYHCGINEKILQDHAMPWHGTNLVQSCGDGTRESRFEGRDGEQLVGHQMHPDCARWILQEIMVPRTVQTLKKIVYLIRKLNLLGAEVYTEQFRCVSDGSIQRLTYATYPEASKGKSGYWLYKYWFTILLLLDGVALCLVFFVTDHCSVGVSAGKMFNTPSAELLALGCSYLGLPLDDYKYYACYCRPAVRANTHGIGFSGYGFAVPYLVLPPSMYCPDVRH
jgi:hypothetical protein